MLSPLVKARGGSRARVASRGGRRLQTNGRFERHTVRAEKHGPAPPPPPSTDTAAAEDAVAATTPPTDGAAAGPEPAKDGENSNSGSASEGVAAAYEQLDALEQALDKEELARDSPAMAAVPKLRAEVDAMKEALETSSTTAKAAAVLQHQLKEKLLRLTADFENFRQRSDSERKDLTARAKGNVLESLLPLIDNFELAAKQVKTETEGEAKINNSYQGLYKQMVDTFRGMGLEAIATEGQVFDPEVHDAIMKEESSEVEDGTILEEFRKGFTLDGKLLRPSMVKVASGGEAKDEGSSESGEDGSQGESK